jgi:biotin carboxylase
MTMTASIPVATRDIRRLFVANRGEIAVRVIRACRTLGIEAVVGVSEADTDTLAAKMADDVVVIGPPLASESYLRADKIVDAALRSGCDAVHPGYGFLSERSSFVRACAEAGLVFVGRSYRRDGGQDHRGEPCRKGRRASRAGIGCAARRGTRATRRRRDRIPGAHQGDSRRRRTRHAHRQGRKRT